MLTQAYCMVCQDRKRFTAKVHDAKRILGRLRELVRSIPKDFNLDKKTVYESRQIFSDSHPHFMCGRCYKVNLQDLKNAEIEILKETCLIKSYLRKEDGDEKEKQFLRETTRRLLAGNYISLRRWIIDKRI